MVTPRSYQHMAKAWIVYFLQQKGSSMTFSSGGQEQTFHQQQESSHQQQASAASFQSSSSSFGSKLIIFTHITLNGYVKDPMLVG